jgi:UDPglucose--hexose-1-phosphate uridylyltransferase
MDLQADVHRRYNPLTGEWLLVSPHRMQRPWQGQTETPAVAARAPYDPDCYLCPGNARAGGDRNPAYQGTYVFGNDFAALRPEMVAGDRASGDDSAGLLVANAESGLCRVVCYSPDHSLTLSGLSQEQLGQLVDCWSNQYLELGERGDINSVQIFENRGAMMGASNPHPHGQIWANRTLPDVLLKESTSQARYLRDRKNCLLCTYAALELGRGERVVCRNDTFVAVVPFWAVWPFETLVLPLQHCASLDQLDAAGRAGLADVLLRVTQGYDALFGVPFPYSMGFHQRPTDGAAHPAWHLHAHFHPPLLRSATVRKFMVGYELLAQPQRDITAEAAAAQLRAVDTHR